jgi:hypothetical protein
MIVSDSAFTEYKLDVTGAPIKVQPNCKTCLYWAWTSGYRGHCLAAMMVEHEAELLDASEMGSEAPVITGEDFGCIKWENA